MSICQITDEKKAEIAPLFEGFEETMIWSCLQGYMGTAWADREQCQDSAQIVIADFCFFAGRASEELVRNRPKEHHSDFVIMIPQNEEWAELIEEVYGEKAKKVSRYAIKKEPDVFECSRLTAFTEEIDSDYELKLIDRELFQMAGKNSWSADLCSQFKSYEDYREKGIGVAAVYKGEIVSGASSYTVYRDGIEIEIDTKEEYRRKGLALACGAKLILECIQRNLYPSWDAQNKGSVALAEKLGYHFDKEYTAYEIYNF